MGRPRQYTPRRVSRALRDASGARRRPVAPRYPFATWKFEAPTPPDRELLRAELVRQMEEHLANPSGAPPCFCLPPLQDTANRRWLASGRDRRRCLSHGMR